MMKYRIPIKTKDFEILNPHYALELRNEGRKTNKIRIFTRES